VYESRVGDVFLLGSSSWRIEEITPDRVLVSPAPGAPARLPYWKSGQIGRPVQLGTAIGIRLRELSALDNQAADESLRHGGLDSWAASNLLAYLDEQRSATGALPDDQTVVVERFRDEVGDWRIAVHCPLGAQVNSPWAMAITQRLTERYGVDAHVMSFDDGIIIRLPYAHGAPPDAGLIVFDADDISARVHATVGQSALFASRFRECAARSLLLPRRHPGRRQPLWLQRQRAAQLLDVARDYAEFPITLEAARECLQDVYDVSALTHLMGQLNSRAVRLVEVETSGPSPFTRKMMFGYAAVFVYELDTPLAERRAAALSMDSTLLNELLGKADLQGLLDDEVLTETERHLQYLTPSRHVRRVDDIVDLLWSIGDLSDDELALRGVPLAWVRQLAEAGRIVEVCIDGQQRWITVEDLDRVSSALSSTSVVHAVGNETADSVGELVGRFARTHIPFSVHACARRFGLSDEVVQQALSTLSERGRVTAGHFTDREGQQWCDYDVLRTLRRRSLAAFRREIAPVAPSTLASFMPRWHRVNSGDTGVNAVMQALEQLQGFAAPASAWERLILPARVADYHPSLLDELCASGAVVWAGAGLISQRDGWLRFVFAETASLLVPPPDPRLDLTALHRQVLSELAGQQGKFFRTLWEDVGRPDETELEVVLWDLVWAGWITNDTLAPLRAALGAGGAHRGQRRQPLVQVRSPGRPATLQRLTQASVAGRWSKLPEREANLTERVTAVADVLLERHGVLTRGAVTAERVPGGFAALYPVLAAMEERGATRRGYFVEGLGAAQFCVPGAVDRLREADSAGSAVLAATDPAHPFGAALPWPRSTGAGDRRTKLGRPGRKPGAVVVLARGRLVLYLERGARSMLTFTDDRTDLAQSGALLAEAMQAGRLGPMVVERIDGNPVQASSPAAVIAGTRFRLTPSGLHLSAATTRG
ncbi:DEAD/DEAH box helicase, partial [Micromonospora sediminicola]|uniref:Lhr family helicase n=1 Tax=Micromonospora sediminicola TaxID=946078 RepID=UPI0034887D25